jgi:prevent-host-death family protein
MAFQLNIADAKARLSELIARAEAGEEVIIARRGRPAVTLTPNPPPRLAKRRVGVWDHLGSEIADDLFIGPGDVTTAAVSDRMRLGADEA